MADITRKLATIEKILAINPIPEADAIECATIRGWNVVVKKEEHRIGELVVYCEIDSLMPEREEFEFLHPRGFRIRTCKMRGQISQGICFPIDILESVGKLQSVFGDPRWEELLILNKPDSNGNTAIPIIEGEDVTEVLGITKWEPQIPAELSGLVKGNFPSHSIKTDEERIQNLIDHYEEFKKEEWIATEKIDGTSMTAYIYNGEFGITSRNLDLKESETNTFWKVARKLDLEKIMRIFMEINGLKALTLQGELLGEGIQKNKYRIKGHAVKWFRAFDPIKYQFFPVEIFFGMMERMGLETVPVINKSFKLPENYEDLILYADEKSMLAETAREGVIFVAKNPAYSDNGRLSFKVISNKFLLKHEE